MDFFTANEARKNALNANNVIDYEQLSDILSNIKIYSSKGLFCFTYIGNLNEGIKRKLESLGYEVKLIPENNSDFIQYPDRYYIQW